MNYFRVQSALISGLQAIPVRVECAQMRRLPYLQILGGGGSSAGEMRERVIAALGTLDREKFRLPARRFTVEISPPVHSLPLDSLDLAVAVAILGSCGQITASRTENLLICGRLGLDGGISQTGGGGAIRRLLREGAFESALLPWEASVALEECHLRRGGGFSSLSALLDFLREAAPGRRCRPGSEGEILPGARVWGRIPGQERAKRVIEIGAAGAHHVLFPTAAGTQVDLLAQALSSLLPPLTGPEAEEVREVYALAGMQHQIPSRPFHVFRSCSALPSLLHDRNLALVEEALLAHRGVLYVDQAGEREPNLFPALLPLMRKGVLVSRFMGRSVEIPAEAVVVASTPLCGCGAAGDPLLLCSCRPTEARQYRTRWRRLLRHPFDLCLNIFPERARRGASLGETGDAAALRVVAARERMRSRGFGWNARLSEEALFTAVAWSPAARRLWETLEARALGGRGDFLAAGRVSVTLHDLREGSEVNTNDLLEALHYLPARGGEGRRGSASPPLVNSTAIPNVCSP